MVVVTATSSVLPILMPRQFYLCLAVVFLAGCVRHQQETVIQAPVVTHNGFHFGTHWTQWTHHPVSAGTVEMVAPHGVPQEVQPGEPLPPDGQLLPPNEAPLYDAPLPNEVQPDGVEFSNPPQLGPDTDLPMNPGTVPPGDQRPPAPMPQHPIHTVPGPVPLPPADSNPPGPSNDEFDPPVPSGGAPVEEDVPADPLGRYDARIERLSARWPVTNRPYRLPPVTERR